jgi:hypothetical protein
LDVREVEEVAVWCVHSVWGRFGVVGARIVVEISGSGRSDERASVVWLRFAHSLFPRIHGAAPHPNLTV